jgi:hypothetical protein
MECGRRNLSAEGEPTAQHLYGSLVVLIPVVLENSIYEALGYSTRFFLSSTPGSRGC